MWEVNENEYIFFDTFDWYQRIKRINELDNIIKYKNTIK